MLKRIQNKAIQKKIARLLNSEGDSSGFKKIESVLVLTDATQSIKDLPIEHLANSLGINTGAIKTLEFTVKKNKNQELLPNQCCKTDFGIQGNYKEVAKPELLNQVYSLVIAYYAKTNYLLDSVLAEQLNTFKAGLGGADSRLLDLEIASQPDSPEIFINELVKYLQVLQLTLQDK